MELVVVLFGLELADLVLPIGVEDITIIALQALRDLRLLSAKRLYRHD